MLIILFSIVFGVALVYTIVANNRRHYNYTDVTACFAVLFGVITGIMLLIAICFQGSQSAAVKEWQIEKQGIEQKYIAILEAEKKGVTDFSITAEKVHVIDEATRFNTDLSGVQHYSQSIWVAPFFQKQVAENITPIDLTQTE